MSAAERLSFAPRTERSLGENGAHMRAENRVPTREELENALRIASRRAANQVESLGSAYGAEEVEDLTEYAEEENEVLVKDPVEQSGTFEIRRDTTGKVAEARQAAPSSESLNESQRTLEQESHALSARYFAEATELASIERELESLERARQIASRQAETMSYREPAGREVAALDEQIDQLRDWRDGQERLVEGIAQRVQENENRAIALRPRMEEQKRIQEEQEARAEFEKVQREVQTYESLIQSQDQQSAILANRVAESMAHAQAVRQNLGALQQRLAAETRTASGWFGLRNRSQVKLLREQITEQEQSAAEADRSMKEAFSEIAKNNKSVEQIMNGSDQAHAKLRVATERLAKFARAEAA